MTPDGNTPWFSQLPIEPMNNLLNPASEQIGKGIGGLASFIMNPFVKMGIISRHNLENFEAKMIEKNSKIPFENRDLGKQGIALKALEDSRYQLNIEELQDMFATLIASSLDNRVNDNVLPSFSTILKDMSLTDAVLFKKLFQSNAYAKVDINLISPDRNVTLPALSNIILFDDFTTDYQPVSIDSLERMGLIIIEQSELVQPNYKEIYSIFEKSDSEYHRRANKQLLLLNDNDLQFKSLSIKKGYIAISELGKKFGSVVID